MKQKFPRASSSVNMTFLSVCLQIAVALIYESSCRGFQYSPTHSGYIGGMPRH